MSHPANTPRTAIVTGGSRGIGAAIAQRLAHDGLRVVVNYAGRADDAQAVVQAITAAGGQAIAVQADVADPAAVARFSADADPHGRIPVPVLTVHGINDPTVFVELESVWTDTMTRAGHADALVQNFTLDSEHSYLSDATYVAALNALQAWIEQGRKPTPATVAAACREAQARFPSSCRFQPDYRPAPLETRVPAR